MEFKSILIISVLVLYFSLLFYFKPKPNKKTVVTNAKKTRNRKKQLRLRKKQVEKWQRKLQSTIEKVEDGDDSLKPQQYELARKLDQARAEIDTLESRIP